MRPKLIIPEDLLRKEVQAAETQTFKTQGEFFEFLANKMGFCKDTNGGEHKLLGSTIRLKILEYNIPIKTKSAKGKKEKVSLLGVLTKEIEPPKPIPKIPKLSRPTIEELPKDFQKAREVALNRRFKKYPETVLQILNNDTDACIRANCIDCQGGSEEEAALCQNFYCPFLSLNPFRSKNESQS